MEPMEGTPTVADREKSSFQPMTGTAAVPADVSLGARASVGDATGADVDGETLTRATEHERLARIAEAERIVRRGIECWNARDFDGFATQHRDDVEVVHVPTGRTLHGSRANLEHNIAWATAFPDGQVNPTRLVTDGHTAVLEFTGRGTQTGPLAGESITIPPTGRHVELQFCYLYDIDDGKISRVREYYDLATMLRQLGVTS